MRNGGSHRRERGVIVNENTLSVGRGEVVNAEDASAAFSGIKSFQFS